MPLASMPSSGRIRTIFGTAPIAVLDLLLLTPSPLVVWGADERRRYLARRRG